MLPHLGGHLHEPEDARASGPKDDLGALREHARVDGHLRAFDVLDAGLVGGGWWVVGGGTRAVSMMAVP